MTGSVLFGFICCRSSLAWCKCCCLSTQSSLPPAAVADCSISKDLKLGFSTGGTSFYWVENKGCCQDEGFMQELHDETMSSWKSSQVTFHLPAAYLPHLHCDYMQEGRKKEI